MTQQNDNIVTCPHCGTKEDRSGLKRNCSNCFSCTDCERYTCPHCNQEIIIKEVRQAYSNRNK